jgi:cytochrome bd-type quinol oxidase subunit 2
MHLSIFPFAILAVFGILALAAWAFTRVLNRAHGSRRVSVRHTIVIMACCTALWLILCFFLMIFASLGHSAHPFRDSWPQCAISFIVLIVAPFALLIWLAKRKSDKPPGFGLDFRFN